MQRTPPPSQMTAGGLTPAMLVALACAAGLPGCGGGADTRAEKPGVNVGLKSIVDEGAVEAGTASTESELEALMALQAAQLAEAYGTPMEEVEAPDLDWVNEAPPETSAEASGEETDTSLANLLGDDSADAAGAAQPEGADTVASEAPDPAEGTDDEVAAEDADTVETLYARLDEALGQELDTTSEPFRTAVAMIALAAAQGRDPLEAIGPETKAGAALSPAERDSAAVVAEMLSSVLSADAADGDSRASALRDLSERLSRTMGLNIPKALLCTEVRGFGRYSEFPKTDFLAGRRVRALLYVEVDRFEHREVDGTGLGGLPIEERWAIDVTQTLELWHDGDSKILAWKRPEEIVVETSRNKQRDFYLLTEIQLPETLTVGSYKLKVIIKDRVANARAEVLVPIGIVADPSLAWSPR